jgi:hypothetical protein
MKRCPHCQFIYPDSDDVCDFDQTRLIAAAEAEIAAITNTPERPALAELAATHSKKFDSRKNRRGLPLVAASGLVLGMVSFVLYFAVHRQLTSQSIREQPVVARPVLSQSPSTSPSPWPSPSSIESPSPQTPTAAEEKPSSMNSKTTAAHSSTPFGPVSTGPPGTQVTSSHKPVILLTSGGKVEADAVWRTKDGIWYRRDGIVTLLKKNRVKAIVNQ